MLSVSYRLLVDNNTVYYTF